MKIPLRKVIDYAMTEPDVVDQAYLDFFGSLDPHDLKQEWEDLFLEWLIFDYRQEGSVSFLHKYVLKNPAKLAEKKLNIFTQTAETNHYSNFEILQIKRGEWLMLEDIFTGKKYKVYEKKGSRQLPNKGTVPGRIAKINGKYYLVGANSVFFPITHTERSKKLMREGNFNKFSPRDTVDLLRNHNKHSPPPVLTKKEIKAKKKKLEAKYNKIAKKYNIALAFEDLIDSIYKEEYDHVTDFWNNLVKNFIKEEVFNKHLQLFQDIWNHFPHKFLNGKSPAELYTESKGK